MDTPRFDGLREILQFESEKVLKAKGADYPPGEDRLGNFKMAAEMLRLITGKDCLPLSAGLVWFVYYVKQLVPFVRFVVEGNSGEGEPPLSRAVDLTNYTFLGYAIGEETATAPDQLVTCDFSGIPHSMDGACANPRPAGE